MRGKTMILGGTAGERLEAANLLEIERPNQGSRGSS